MVIAGPITEPGLGSLPLRRTKRLSHLGFQRRLDHRFHRGSEELRIARQQGFDIDDLALTLNLGHGVLPRQRVGDVRHHPHTMAARPQRILQNKTDSTRPFSAIKLGTG